MIDSRSNIDLSKLEKINYNIFSRKLKNISSSLKQLTGRFRIMPDFIIIGAQKCGTTSLYHYLTLHPEIISAESKEIHFFNINYMLGLNWYKSKFPTLMQKYITKTISRKNFLTGEASPYYINHVHTPKRIHKTISNVKIIAILRNPVDRAYSHFNFNIKQKLESLSFEDALKAEKGRLEGEKEKMMIDPHYNSNNYRNYSYLNRGIYIDQIKTWMNLFPKEQFLILRTEDLESNPNTVLKQTFEFLNLPDFTIQNTSHKNVGNYKEMNSDTRKWLIEYFKPHNEKLYKYLERDFQWDK